MTDKTNETTDKPNEAKNKEQIKALKNALTKVEKDNSFYLAKLKTLPEAKDGHYGSGVSSYLQAKAEFSHHYNNNLRAGKKLAKRIDKLTEKPKLKRKKAKKVAEALLPEAEGTFDQVQHVHDAISSLIGNKKKAKAESKYASAYKITSNPATYISEGSSWSDVSMTSSTLTFTTGGNS